MAKKGTRNTTFLLNALKNTYAHTNLLKGVEDKDGIGETKLYQVPEMIKAYFRGIFLL